MDDFREMFAGKQRRVQSTNSRWLLPWIWPLIAGASISRTAAAGFDTLAKNLATDGQGAPQSSSDFDWATSHRLTLDLASMRLRDFSLSQTGPTTIICAPFALHGATVADFAPGHSLVERLRREGIQRLFVTDWRSATAVMKDFSIDTYLADLNVAVDDCGAPVNLVGLCQGGWLALAYAARFPWKVGKLVLAGSPIDIAAGSSPLSELAATTPLSTFQQLVELGEGRMLGRHLLAVWGAWLAGQTDASHVLQSPAEGVSDELQQRFQRWCMSAVDLPGAYYLQVVQRVFKENQIARGQFVALGRQISLADIRVPLALLAATFDEIVNEQQMFAVARLVGTAAADLIELKEPCGHLSLFIGAKTLDRAWPRIARWLNHDSTLALAS
ncbi:alpha/beta fold hydrolase [Rhodoplanes sp. Z2-YC6860]|uniref:alpha/beta fold hydrolase n=1 Tax=Rhodoplanes sp. Z2-YC6860 TaxID=674703 RepID=UPI00078CFD27|nr:alpha/beta fold hydrolase [Rhodoplanes sp. Z2-YC6860]AMN38481.1 poly(3-hydroxyalkanoate) synthetase [Rhodoplanes sp. Z2-YC6860]